MLENRRIGRLAGLVASCGVERVITIAGGGLAGLSLGIALRRRGDPVILHEAGVYPRHRVCGEFISGVSDATFDMLGIADLFQDARRHRTTAWFFRERRVLATQLPAGLGISRFSLDHRLSARFQELGGILSERSRLKPRSEEGVVWCAGRMPARGRWIGLKCHVSALELGADLEMHLASNGYVGLARVEASKVNVCGLFRLEPKLSGKGAQTLEQYLRAGNLDGLAMRIFSARVDAESFLGVAGFRLGRQPKCNGIATLGDAWAMIPPFTGNGMSMAFESAAIAAEPFHAWQTGRQTWERALDRIRQGLASRFAKRMFWARAMHPFLTTAKGQALFTVVSRSGLLPFKSCFCKLR
jgi:flavin-dependent dehydrogenase